MESVQAIVATILKHVETLPSENVPLMQSIGCIAGKELVADADFPSATLALADGFALRHAWLQTVSPQNPARFPISSRNSSSGGAKHPIAIPVQLFDHVPRGFDVIIPRDGAVVSDHVLIVAKPLEKWENILPLGANIRKGDVLLFRGDEITYSDVGTASYLGLKSFPVIRKPRVALVLVCSVSKRVKDYETVNNYLRGISDTISAQVLKYRGVFRRYKILSDFSESDRETIARAFDSDMVLFMGQSPEKKQDGLVRILEEMGVRIHLKTKNVHPGHFFSFGTVEEKSVFLLPNDPSGAILNFEEFIRPALFKMRGKKHTRHEEINARLGSTLFNTEGKINLIQAFVHLKNGVFYAVPIGTERLPGVRKMRTMNGIIVLPENVKKVPMGSVTRVQMLRQPDWSF